MRRQGSTTATLDVIRLLDEIVGAFADGETRPADQIALYEKYLELQKTHKVKLRGRFIVIAGGGSNRSLQAITRSRRRAKASSVSRTMVAAYDSADSLPGSA